MGTNWKKNLAFTVLLAVMGLATACTNAEQERTEADAEQAWTDFKSSAERAENDAQRNWDEATDEVRAETREWETDYDRNVARADSYSTRWDDNRKKEYETYKTRYRTADETRRANYQTYEKRTQMAGSLLGGQQISGMTPENAHMMFKTFVDNLQDNKAQYSKEDWAEADRVFDQLQERYAKLENVSTKDQAKILKEKTRYTGIRGAGNIDARVDINEE